MHAISPPCRKKNLSKRQYTSLAKCMLPLLPKAVYLKKKKQKEKAEEAEEGQNEWMINCVDLYELLPRMSHLVNPGICKTTTQQQQSTWWQLFSFLEHEHVDAEHRKLYCLLYITCITSSQHNIVWVSNGHLSHIFLYRKWGLIGDQFWLMCIHLSLIIKN